MGAVNSFGYGIVGLGIRGSSNDRAHRIVYRHHYGEIPAGKFVCHTCDVPSCCNPHHLFVGSNQDNVDDMIRKKRNSRPPRNPHVIGEVHPFSKFTDVMVADLRAVYQKGGVSMLSLAKKHGVANSTMQRILQGKRYKHV
jgi:hypothetical protein